MARPIQKTIEIYNMYNIFLQKCVVLILYDILQSIFRIEKYKLNIIQFIIYKIQETCILCPI